MYEAELARQTEINLCPDCDYKAHSYTLVLLIHNDKKNVQEITYNIIKL